MTTSDAIDRFTIRRGLILKFSNGACAALDGLRCGVHRGRPLACRLYPLGIERDNAGGEKFITLEAAAGSLGVYGNDGTVNDFLETQNVGAHLEANDRYASLLPIYRERIAATVDFERVLPREFWRRAVREALAESGYDPNTLIDATFDSDRLGCGRVTDTDTISAHIEILGEMIRSEMNADVLAAAAVMLAVSLGYSPSEVTIDC